MSWDDPIQRGDPTPPPAPPPAAKESVQDVQGEIFRIESDVNHPMHQKWQDGDPYAVEHVSNLYRKMYGGTIDGDSASGPRVDAGDLSETEKAMMQTWAKEIPSAEDRQKLDTEISDVVSQVGADLKKEWGTELEENLSAAQAAALDIFGSNEKIDEFAWRTGIASDPKLQAEAVKLLAKLGKGKR